MNVKDEHIQLADREADSSQTQANGRRIDKRLPRKHGYTAKLREVPAHFMPDWLDRMDQRYATVRKLRERFRALVEDRGGIEELSYAQQTLAKRAIHLEALIETMEAGLLRGDDVDINKYINAINGLTNALRTLGLQKKGRRSAPPKPISKMGG